MHRENFSKAKFRHLVLMAVSCLLISVVSRSLGVENKLISAKVHYPTQIQAGENFELKATILNTGTEPVLSSIHWVLRSGDVSGSHEASYKILSKPLREATPYTRIFLEPGIPYEIPLREFYYKNENLVRGDLRIAETKILISDTTWQSREVIVEPITISITNENLVSTLNTKEPIVRLPLERREANSENNETWLVYDPNTNLEWVPLSETHNMSLVSVLEKLTPNGEFAGFRVATLEELKSLFLNAIQSSNMHYPDYLLFAQDEYEGGDFATGIDLISIVQELQQLFDVTDFVDRAAHKFSSTNGILIGTNEVPEAVLEASVLALHQPTRGSFYLGPVQLASVTSSNTTGGVWLLRESDR